MLLLGVGVSFGALKPINVASSAVASMTAIVPKTLEADLFMANCLVEVVNQPARNKGGGTGGVS